MPVKHTHSLLFFTVPSNDKLDEAENYVKFKKMLRDKIENFVELESDEYDDGKPIFIITVEGKENDIEYLECEISRIVDKCSK